MKLRYLILCDVYGGKSEPSLQYWDDELKKWVDVVSVECKEWMEDEANNDPNFDGS